MPETVEVPASMVMVHTVREGKEYIQSNEVIDLVNETAGLKYAAFVNSIFHLPNDGDNAKFKAAVDALRKSFIDKIQPRITPVSHGNRRDDLLIMQHAIKPFFLDGYPANDNTGRRAHLLYAFLGILLGKTESYTFLKLLEEY